MHRGPLGLPRLSGIGPFVDDNTIPKAVPEEDIDDIKVTIAEESMLSEREAETLLYKRRGLTHAEVARMMNVEKSTVDEFSRRMKEKFEVAKTTAGVLEDIF